MVPVVLGINAATSAQPPSSTPRRPERHGADALTRTPWVSTRRYLEFSDWGLIVPAAPSNPGGSDPPTSPSRVGVLPAHRPSWSPAREHPQAERSGGRATFPRSSPTCVPSWAISPAAGALSASALRRRRGRPPVSWPHGCGRGPDDFVAGDLVRRFRRGLRRRGLQGGAGNPRRG